MPRSSNDPLSLRQAAYECANSHTFTVTTDHGLPRVAVMCPVCERPAYMVNPPDPHPGQLELHGE